MTTHLKRWLLALALLTFPAVAQDRLEPVTPPNDVYSRARDANLRTAFREAYEPRVEVRAFIYPSWAPEIAVGLRRGANGHEIFLLGPALQISRYASVDRTLGGHDIVAPEHREQQLRDAEAERRRLPARVSDVSVGRCSAAVDEETAAALIRAWRRMLQQIEPNRDGMVMFDGVHFSFSMTIGGRLVEGTTWRGMQPALAAAMADYCVTSSRTSWIAIWTVAFWAMLSLVPGVLLLGWGFQRITGRRVPAMDRVRPVLRRRGFILTYATVSILLVAFLAYAVISGWSSREVLRIAEVIASAR